MIMKSHLYSNPSVSHIAANDSYPRHDLIQPLRKLFLKHPYEAGETYFQHFRFTFSMSSRIILTGVILLIHGFLPFLFTKTTSGRITAIDRIMQERLDKLAESADE